MATQTFQFAEFGNGQVVVEFDVNDANWNITRVRCLNNSPYAAVANVLRDGAQIMTVTGPANSTQQWNVSGVKISWDSVDGGLMLGSYILQARWPVGA